MNLGAAMRARWLLATLLVTAAALFGVGVVIERGSHHEPATTAEAGVHDETAEHAGEDSSAERVDPAADRPAHTEDGERIAGLNVESTPLIAAALLVTAVLAALTAQYSRSCPCPQSSESV